MSPGGHCNAAVTGYPVFPGHALPYGDQTYNPYSPFLPGHASYLGTGGLQHQQGSCSAGPSSSPSNDSRNSSDSPDIIRGSGGGYTSSRSFYTNSSPSLVSGHPFTPNTVAPPSYDMRLNPAPENTRPQHYNHGLPHRHTGLSHRQFHSGGGGAAETLTSGGGGPEAGSAAVTGQLMNSWSSQQVTNMQDSFNPGVMSYPQNSGYAPFMEGDSLDQSQLQVILHRLEISEEELILMQVRDLNKKLKSKGIDRNTQKLLKQQRRTMKNRGYAASCRIKRDNQICNLKTLLSGTEHENQCFNQNVTKIKGQSDMAKTSYNSLLTLAQRVKLPVGTKPMSRY